MSPSADILAPSRSATPTDTFRWTPRRLLGAAVIACGLILAIAFLIQSPPAELAALEPDYTREWQRDKLWRVLGCAVVAVIGLAAGFTKFEGTGLPEATARRVNARTAGGLFLTGVAWIVGSFFGLVPAQLAHSEVPIEPGIVQAMGAALIVLGGLFLALARRGDEEEGAAGGRPDP